MSAPPARNLVRKVVHGTDWSHRITHPVTIYTNPTIEALLSKPSWSVRSLIPPRSSTQLSFTEPFNLPDDPTEESQNKPPPRSLSSSLGEEEPEITPSKLHHLLRLSALPQPKSPAEEASMLKTLRSQIHFVRAIQRVDTSNIQPLVAIRDETQESVDEQTVKVADLQPWLDLEEKVGKNGTLRRRRIESERIAEGKEGAGKLRMGEMTFDAFEMGMGSGEGESEGRRRGRWFVVKKKRADASREEIENGRTREVEAEAG